MQTSRSVLLTLTTALGLTPLGSAFGQTPADAERDLPTQILVDLADDTGDADERAIEAKLGGLDLRLNSIHAQDERFFIAEVRADDLDRLIAAVRDDPRVEHVEPNYTYRATMIPDDPRFQEQWSMAMVGATHAWDSANGTGAVVAVIDTGVAYGDRGAFRQVEDLAETRFQEGYDFVGDTDTPNDDHGHGTHVAGTIAQSTDNGRGVAGLAFGATIMPVKVLDRSGRGTAADIADAIRWAADQGANVINMSLGGGLPSLTMAAAVDYARKKGVVVVCAAGNGSRGKVEYPAAYPGAFAVSAVGPDRELAFYSSWGKQLAIAAPGGDKSKGGEKGGILQNTIVPGEPSATDRYLSFQGTSMATPHVAAAAALLYSAGVTDAGEIERILRETATDAGERGWDEKYGSGILNAQAAVGAARGQTRGLPHLVAGLLLLALFFWRYGKRTAAKLGLTAILGAVMGASGLFFLDRFGLSNVPGLGALAHPIARWDLLLVGPSLYHSALFASVLPMLGLTTVLLGMRRATSFLVGLAIGWAGHLLVSVALMPADVTLIPGVAGVLDRGWLLINAAALLFLARLVSQRRAGL